MQEMAQEIMEEVAQEQERFLELMAVLAYVGLFLLLFMYLQCVQQKKTLSYYCLLVHSVGKYSMK